MYFFSCCFDQDVLHPLCYLYGDPTAPGQSIIVDIFSNASFAGKITLGDDLALGAPEFVAKPFRKAMRGIESAVEFVHFIREGISTTDHERQHACYPQVAVFDFADL